MKSLTLRLAHGFELPSWVEMPPVLVEPEVLWVNHST